MGCAEICSAKGINPSSLAEGYGLPAEAFFTGRLIALLDKLSFFR